jgi:hypothetical protein
MELTTSQAMQVYKVFPNVLHRLILGQTEGAQERGWTLAHLEGIP